MDAHKKQQSVLELRATQDFVLNLPETDIIHLITRINSFTSASLKMIDE